MPVTFKWPDWRKETGHQAFAARMPVTLKGPVLSRKEKIRSILISDPFRKVLSDLL